MEPSVQRSSFPISHQISLVAEADDDNREQKGYNIDFNEYSIDVSSPSKNIWTRFIDHDSGYAYYVNDVTGESKWADVEESNVLEPKTSSPSGEKTTAIDSDWIEYTDPDSGHIFYFNEVIIDLLGSSCLPNYRPFHLLIPNYSLSCSHLMKRFHYRKLKNLVGFFRKVYLFDSLSLPSKRFIRSLLGLEMKQLRSHPPRKKLYLHPVQLRTVQRKARIYLQQHLHRRRFHRIRNG